MTYAGQKGRGGEGREGNVASVLDINGASVRVNIFFIHVVMQESLAKGVKLVSKFSRILKSDTSSFFGFF